MARAARERSEQEREATPATAEGSPARAAPKVRIMKGEPLALERTLPSYGGRCVTEVTPGILAGTESELVNGAVANAPTVVLFVVDGLGWHQLLRHRTLAPTLAAASDTSSPVTTVAPSTTATALTSLTTGATPGEHGLVGYRVPTELGLLNALRWRAGGQDARVAVQPEKLQPVVPFCGRAGCGGDACRVPPQRLHRCTPARRGVLGVERHRRLHRISV